MSSDATFLRTNGLEMCANCAITRLALFSARLSAHQKMKICARIANFEKQLIITALEATNGNVVAAINILKIPRKVFHDKIGRYSLDPASFRTTA